MITVTTDQDSPGTTVVSVTGDVDLSSSRNLQEHLKRAVASAPSRLIVNLVGVDYMDSSGVATLVETMQLTQQHDTRLVLTNLGERVRSIFEIAKLDAVFTIAADLDSARTL